MGEAALWDVLKDGLASFVPKVSVHAAARLLGAGGVLLNV